MPAVIASTEAVIIIFNVMIHYPHVDLFTHEIYAWSCAGMT